MSVASTPDPAASENATQTSSPVTDPAANSTTAVSTEPAGVEQVATPSATPSTTEVSSEPDALVPQAEWEQLKADPEAAFARLNKAFTEKTQSLSQLKKSVQEREQQLGAWAQLAQAFNEDPQATYRALGAHLGITVPAANQPTAPPTEAQVSAGDQAVVELRKSLEEFGLEALADKMAPVIRKIAEDTAGQRLRPIEENTSKLLTEAAQRELNIVMDQFTKKFPDWKQHETAMHKLAQQIKPATDGQGRPIVSELDYLEQLYFLVNRENLVKAETQKAIQRMTAAAQSAQPTPGGRVANNQVQSKAPSGATFRDAYEAAKRGESWD